MPFKDRVKRAFRRTSSSASGSDERTTGPPPPAPIIRTTTSGSTYEIYGPGECPPSKYKGPWDQAHQDRLKAFAMRFDGFGRRRSGTSQYSPGGTRMPSRSVSRATSRGESRGPSRAGSMRSLKRRALGIASGGSGSQHHVNQVKESVDDDGDVANVGLSRQVSPDTTRNSLQLSRQTSPILRRRPSASSWSSPLARQITSGSVRGTTESLVVPKRARSNSRPQEPETIAGALEAATLNAGNQVIHEVRTPDVPSERPSPTKALTQTTVKPAEAEPAREESQHTIHASQDGTATEQTTSKAESHMSSQSDQQPTRSSSHTSESALQSLASSTHRKDSASTATAISQHQSLSLATSQTSKNASYPVSNGAASSGSANDTTSTSQEQKSSLPPLATTSSAIPLSSTTSNLSNPANTNMATSPVEYDSHFTPDELAKALHSASETGLAATFRKKTRQSLRRDSTGSGEAEVDQGLSSSHSSWSRKSGLQMKSKRKSFINLIR